MHLGDPAKQDPETRHRIKLEVKIIEALVDHALAEGLED